MTDAAVVAVAGAVITLVATNAAALIGWYNSKIAKDAVLESKVDRLIQDVDAIAEIIGTKRALARKEKQNG